VRRIKMWTDLDGQPIGGALTHRRQILVVHSFASFIFVMFSFRFAVTFTLAVINVATAVPVDEPALRLAGRAGPATIYTGCTVPNKVALTFDDGPCESATFFLAGLAVQLGGSACLRGSCGRVGDHTYKSF
jgi:hypothetical protein